MYVVASGQSLRAPPSPHARESYVLVTVGSTQFNELIEAIDNDEFLETIKAMGFKGLHIQYGKHYAQTPRLIYRYRSSSI